MGVCVIKMSSTSNLEGDRARVSSSETNRDGYQNEESD